MERTAGFSPAQELHRELKTLKLYCLVHSDCCTVRHSHFHVPNQRQSRTVPVTSLDHHGRLQVETDLPVWHIEIITYLLNYHRKMRPPFAMSFHWLVRKGPPIDSFLGQFKVSSFFFQIFLNANLTSMLRSSKWPPFFTAVNVVMQFSGA